MIHPITYIHTAEKPKYTQCEKLPNYTNQANIKHRVLYFILIYPFQEFSFACNHDLSGAASSSPRSFS